LGVLAHLDQLGALQHTEVLRDRRWCQGEWSRQFANGRFATRQPGQDRTPRWVGQRDESIIKARHAVFLL
jgi:hypothetical protein